MDSVLRFLPRKLSLPFDILPTDIRSNIEEIRIRIGRPIEVSVSGKPIFLSVYVSEEDALQLINNLSQFSFYTLDEELKRGYITIQGGHRVGLAGKVILENGRVKAIREISSFNIRIAREKIGVAHHILPYLYMNHWRHTMIIGPPQTGKTTLLRDLARVVSTGYEKLDIPPRKVGIVDERSEIAGCVKGVPQLQFGHRVDVLDGCPKAEGMMMLIRSMSPDVLIADEIGREEDADSVLEAANAGIKLMITTHGASLEEIKSRPTIKKILDLKIFERFIELRREETSGLISTVFDHKGNNLMLEMGVT
jgi:stage III sporulation protein AA